MNCRFCGSWNEEVDHRCHRCGRRLRPAAARPAPEAYPLTDAAAPQLEALRRAVEDSGQPHAAAQPPAVAHPFAPSSPASPKTTPGYQPSLFRSELKVIPIPTLAPVRAESEPGWRGRAPMARPPRRSVSGQQPALDFQVVHPVSAAAEPCIVCDAPVASPAHRAMAAMLDAALVFVAVGAFLVVFLLGGGSVAWSKQTLPLLGAIAVVFYLFYQLLFVLASGDTAGLRWVQLRLVDFDGRRPNREQRAQRMAGEMLSVIAAGLGLLWSLVDEESLTWHDHISKTFPSPDIQPRRR
jgi:uncharacterized RDD family membrane protein YckC